MSYWRIGKRALGSSVPACDLALRQVIYKSLRRMTSFAQPKGREGKGKASFSHQTASLSPLPFASTRRSKARRGGGDRAKRPLRSVTILPSTANVC